jgi:hypothetical protein
MKRGKIQKLEDFSWLSLHFIQATFCQEVRDRERDEAASARRRYCFVARCSPQ